MQVTAARIVATRNHRRQTCTVLGPSAFSKHLVPRLVPLSGKINPSCVESYRRLTFGFSNNMPSKDVLLDVVNAYFQYCHMQPLWLFDREDFSSIENCREETIFSLLSLSLCHSKHPFFRGRSDELSQRYAQLAREHIMRRIVEGKVSLSTIQSLCMLAFANFQGEHQPLSQYVDKRY